MNFRHQIAPNLLEGFRSTVALTGREKLRFLAEDRRETFRSARLLGVLAIFLVPFFSILDHYSYPEHFFPFLSLRIFCVLAIVITLLLMKFRVLRRFYRSYAIIIPMIPAFTIGAMIYLMRDPGTPYYAGLTLCLVAIGFVFSWTYREALIASVVIFLVYLFASVPSLNAEISTGSAASFANNMLFILANSVIVTLSCLANHGRRLREFRTRQQVRRQQVRLEAKNEELETALVELGETEQQLIQSEKMASLGQLSAGVIHEIGNPLNFSNQALFILRKRLRKLGSEEHFTEIIGDMQEGFDRMKEIVGELREFTHGANAEKAVFSADSCVQSAIRMMGKEIEESGAKLDVDIAPGIPIPGVKNQITQVIINLIQNAIHACEETQRSAHIAIGGEKAGEYFLLSVTDNGCGIQDHHAKLLFDPFFTTKDPGRGTGLGLSISFRIIEAHGGTISADSVIGESTTFKIMLPAVIQQVGSDATYHLQN